MSAKSADTAARARASGAQWVDEPERGSAAFARIMTFLALRLGRKAGLAMLWLIAAYFYLFAPTARRHSREYLRRALAPRPYPGRFFPAGVRLRRDHSSTGCTWCMAAWICSR